MGAKDEEIQRLLNELSNQRRETLMDTKVALDIEIAYSSPRRIG